MGETFRHPRYLFLSAMPANLLGDFETAARRYRQAAGDLRATGAFGELPLVLQLLSQSLMLGGDLVGADTASGEGLRLARDTGQLTPVCVQLATQAQVAAVRGQEDDARRLATESLELAGVRGLPWAAANALWALGLLELGAGRPEVALTHLERMVAGTPITGHRVAGVYSTPDRAEAAVRSGNPEAAAAALESLSLWAEHLDAAVPSAWLARVRGLVADDDSAEGHFETALALHARSPQPLSQARTQLDYGEWLRRARRRVEAREQLRAALEAFESVGARPWAERARTELRATGLRNTRTRGAGAGADAKQQLTPQELHIATLVSSGVTNRDVAAKLFLSPRTVEYHLHKVFGKLGISSRHELASTLGIETGDATDARSNGIGDAVDVC